jgi:phage head maturation protease
MNDVKFNIVTGLLKAYEGGDGLKRLRTTASSTVLDLGGDQMELSALQSMAQTAQQNMTLFLNHKYQVPEDVLGSVEAAAIRDAGGVWDLDFDVRVEESNPRAVSTWMQIQNGTKLGCSIGARIPEGGYEKTETGLKIKQLVLMEASIVGIPANPRSFVHSAMKALHAAEAEEEMTVTTDSATTATVTFGAATTTTVGEAGPETVTIVRETEPPAEAEPVGDTEEERKGPLTSEDFPGLSEEPTEPQPPTEPPTESEAAPEGDSADSSEPSQEASLSVPESDGIDDEDTRAVIAKGIETLQSLLSASNEELVESRKALAGETEARVRAERELAQAKDDLKLARDIVERISALPIGRRTSFKAAASEFRTRFSGVYDDETLQLMERNTNGGE